jgi:hypothetical protein
MQFMCCSSIYEVVSLKAQKVMIRAFLTLKEATGLGQFCELDIMRQVRLIASKTTNCYINSQPYTAIFSAPSPQSSMCTFSFSTQERLLERVGMLM